MNAVFLKHREEIFSKVGVALFPHIACSDARRSHVKKIFAAYDNDATLGGWMKKMSGLPRGATMRGVAVEVGKGPGISGIVFRP